jgi:endothelin-converting enzyme/putative endopeptidase
MQSFFVQSFLAVVFLAAGRVHADPLSPAVEMIQSALSNAVSAAGKLGPTADCSAGLSQKKYEPFLVSLLDESADPCRDFYQFSCGQIDKVSIPDDRMMSGTISDMSEKNNILIRDILEDYARGGKSFPENPDAEKLGKFYSACMNEEVKSAAAKAIYQGLTAEISQSDDRQKLSKVMAQLQGQRVATLFGIAVAPKPPSMQEMGVALVPPDLGMSGDQLTQDQDFSKKARSAYQDYIVSNLKLTGVSSEEAGRRAQTIMAMKVKLARIEPKPEEARQMEKWKSLSLQELSDQIPAVDWKVFFSALGLPQASQVVTISPEYLRKLGQVLGEFDSTQVKQYLDWEALSASANDFGPAFKEHRLKMLSTIYGLKQSPPRWKICVQEMSQLFPYSISRSFVAKHSSAATRTAASEVVTGVSRQFDLNMEQLQWMDSSTKGRAIQKLSAQKDYVGYPDNWSEYDYELKGVRGASYKDDLNQAKKNSMLKNFSQVDRPLEKDGWMPPFVVNAGYSPFGNNFIVTAAILQPPLFDPKKSLLENYARIGAVIGHEKTHGFDDQGRRFNQVGAKENWWTAASSEKFENGAKCIATQFDQFVTPNGVHQNGENVTGEAIGDIGGTKLAYQAWKNSGEFLPDFHRLNPEQQFFVTWAQSYCQKIRPELESILARNEVHPLPRFRVNGSLSNIPEFQKVFGCKNGDPMAPKKRCEIW